jgi:hypothetical protein
MSKTLRRVQMLALREELLISEHGLDELLKDDILLGDVIRGLVVATAIEDYPERRRGPGVLTLQRDAKGQPIHVVYGRSPPDKAAPPYW